MSERIHPLRTFSRRHLLGLGVGTAAYAAVGCGDGPSNPDVPSTIPTPLPNAEPIASPGGYLENVAPSLKEQSLWKNTQFLFLSPTATDSEIESQVSVRTNEIIGKMLASENPEIRNGGNTINQLGKLGILTITPIKTDPGIATENLMSARSTFNKDLGKIVYNLDLYVTNIAGLNEVRIALALTHEAQHFTDKLTMAEQARKQGLREEDITPEIAKFVDQNCTLNESWAYATETKAYIYQTKLMPNYVDPEQEFRAIKFAESNFDENSITWQNTVRKNVGCTT